jgi:hypothetical protein
VLALSSPAHIKSKTSSGRVLEGFAAGVPVISDDNHHVRSQFGDLVYYFEGATERERSDSIQAALDDIRARPHVAIERVREAQDLISRKYSFEVCLEEARAAVERSARDHSISFPAMQSSRDAGVVVDVFLFFHDPYAPDKRTPEPFTNVAHILRSMASLTPADGVRFRVRYLPSTERVRPEQGELPTGVEWIELDEATVPSKGWNSLRLGEKVARLAPHSTGDFAVFFTQFDFPHHDYFVKTLEWFASRDGKDPPALHIGGFFVNDFRNTAQFSAGGILRCSASNGLYRWTQNTIAEHQLAQLCFNRAALSSLSLDRMERFDVLLPVAAVLDCQVKGMEIHRARHLLVRTLHGYYHRYHDAFSHAAGKGLWAKHYDLLSNATHEIHGLYDAFHESPEAVAIADKIYGIDIPPPPPAPGTEIPHPATLQVAGFLNRISPYVVRAKKVLGLFRLGR